MRPRTTLPLTSSTGHDSTASQPTNAATSPSATNATGTGAVIPTSMHASMAAGTKSFGSRDNLRSSRRLRSWRVLWLLPDAVAV